MFILQIGNLITSKLHDQILKIGRIVPMGGAYHIFMSANAPQVPYDTIGPKIAFRQYTLSLKVEKVSIFAPGNFFVES